MVAVVCHVGNVVGPFFCRTAYLLSRRNDKKHKPIAPHRSDVKNHTARNRRTVVLQATVQQEHQKHQKRRSPTSSRAYPTSTYNSCTIHYSVPRLYCIYITGIHTGIVVNIVGSQYVASICKTRFTNGPDDGQ